MKSDKIEEELKCAEEIIKALGGGDIQVEKINLSKDITRCIVTVKKISITPEKFPRKSKLIGRN
jgi:hypothetical protein